MAYIETEPGPALVATDPRPLLAPLHRGGKFAYLWGAPSKRSVWFPVGDPLPSLSDKAIYFGVHPTAMLPVGALASQRSKIETVSVVNALFSEFDDKDYSNDHVSLWSDVISALNPPPSAVIDSGGGYHCYWFLREPFCLRTDADRKRAQQAQEAWVMHTGGDEGAKDLARVLRLPGTMNRKYSPARRVSILSLDTAVRYDLAQLESRIDHGVILKLQKPAAPVGEKIPHGVQHKTLVSLAGTMRRRGMDVDEIEAALQVVNERRCEIPGPPENIREIARSMMKYEPQDVPYLNDSSNGDGKNGDGEPTKGYQTGDDISAAFGSVTWAWPGWFPVGHVSMIAGPQAVGKSYLAAHIATCLAGVQTKWPNRAAVAQRDRRPVVICDTEQMRGVYQERFTAMGMPSELTIYPGADPFYVCEFPQDTASVLALAQELDAAAVIVDSLSGGHRVDENTAQVREVLQSLSHMAGTLHVPVILVHHVRKRKEQESSRLGLDRVRGSNTITQFCRSVIGAFREDEFEIDAPVRVEPLKASFCKPAAPFGFTITDGGLVFHDAPELKKPRSALSDAVDWLRGELAEKPQSRTAMLELAERDNLTAQFSVHTIDRAAKALNVNTIGGKWTLP